MIIDLEGEKKGLEEQVAIMSANLFQGDTIEKERIKKHLAEHLFRIEVIYIYWCCCYSSRAHTQSYNNIETK
jgi:hypothetical protein